MTMLSPQWIQANIGVKNIAEGILKYTLDGALPLPKWVNKEKEQERKRNKAKGIN